MYFVYFAQQFTWSAVLNFHGAVLLEIERGDSFMHLENRSLYGDPLPETSTTKPPVKSSSSNSSPLPLLFCCDYQRDVLCLILLFLTSLFLTTAGVTYPRFVRSLLRLNKRFWLRRNLARVTDPPPPSLRKNRRRGVCDSPSLIVYGGHVIFRGMCGKWFDWLLLVDHENKRIWFAVGPVVKTWAANQKIITFTDNYTHVAFQIQGFRRKEKKLKSLLKGSLALLKSFRLQRGQRKTGIEGQILSQTLTETKKPQEIITQCVWDIPCSWPLNARINGKNKICSDFSWGEGGWRVCKPVISSLHPKSDCIIRKNGKTPFNLKKRFWLHRNPVISSPRSKVWFWPRDFGCDVKTLLQN